MAITTHTGEWQTVARIQAAEGAVDAQLLVQYGSADLDLVGYTLDKDSEIGFLLRSRLTQAQTRTTEARLILTGKDEQTIDASAWPEDEIQEWLDQRRQDFITEEFI